MMKSALSRTMDCLCVLFFSECIEGKLVSNSSNCMCTQNQFKCLDGACIKIERHCDGNMDCSDGSDEKDCGKYMSFCRLPYSALDILCLT